jgi:hypothetical protein
MRWRRRTLPVAVAVTAGAAGVLLLLADGDDRDSERSGASPTPSSPRVLLGGVRGCRERVEGGRLLAQPDRDTVIGPVTFVAAGSNFRAALGSRKLASKQKLPPGLRQFPFKLLVLVRSGVRVRLVVPADQRRWMRLFYGGRKSGEHVITLHACRHLGSRVSQRRECHWTPLTACRWNNTQFAGAAYVDFDAAPRHGRCADVVVKVPHSRAYRDRLFQERPGDCPPRS